MCSQKIRRTIIVSPVFHAMMFVIGHVMHVFHVIATVTHVTVFVIDILFHNTV